MNPGLWGLATALCWGNADFIARFTGRALHFQTALLGMLAVGSVAVSIWVWAAGIPFVWSAAGLPQLVFLGVGTMISTWLLYQGLSRGPVSIVSPIVGAYPAIVVAIHVLFGVRPTALQWLAMAVTMVGVVVVARSAGNFEEAGKVSRADLRKTVLISLGSAFAFGLCLYVYDLAVPIYGDIQTLWASRVISLVAIVLVFAAQRRRPTSPGRWWPLLVLQGVLDTAGYLTLLQASYGEGAEIAAVTSSAFGAVTTILARIFLRERMSLLQWLGIALVFAGVAALSA